MWFKVGVARRFYWKIHEASNYINARISGLTLAEARIRIEREIEAKRAQLDELTARVVTEGLATWSGNGDDHKSLIVCGRAHLLEDVKAMKLTRAKLESLVDDLIQKTIGPCQNALKDAGLKPAEINEVVLVGGMIV